jgi:ectoine hydroxylase-related dioxygenase (phytanoyl-CoA dioxygenase family)
MTKKNSNNLNRSSKKFCSEGFFIKSIDDRKIINDINSIIVKSNHGKIKDKKTFHLKSLKIQDNIYRNKYHIKILKNEFPLIKSLLKIKSLREIKITSFVHLRAVKKNNKKTKKNFLGFHRETFYSDHDYTRHQINISVALLNYNPKNSMKIIKGTHLIPDSRIITTKVNSNVSGVKKDSLEHKLGLPYNPKIIQSGINLNKARRANLKNGQMMVFSALLIHGNGSNDQKYPRYSIDFGIIKKKYLKGKKIKDHHISYSQNKKYWIDINQ